MRTSVLLFLVVVGAFLLNSAEGQPGQEPPQQENKRTGLTEEEAPLQENKREDPIERRHSGRAFGRITTG